MKPDDKDNLAEWRKQKGKEDLRSFGDKTKAEKERLRFHVSWMALLLTPCLLFALLLAVSIVQEILFIPENREIDRKLESFQLVKNGMPEAAAIRITGQEPRSMGGVRYIEYYGWRPQTILGRLFGSTEWCDSHRIEFVNGIATNNSSAGPGFLTIVY